MEQPVSVMIALDVSGSMPWFVTQPTGGITSLDDINNWYNRNAYNLNTGGNTGVGAWSEYKYYVIHIQSGLAINGYYTMASAIDYYKEDLENGIKKLESEGKSLEDMIQKGIERFNRLKEQDNIHTEK